MSICMKVIKDGHYQVNLCDKELIGIKLNEVTINNHFYGEESSVDLIIIELSKATLINALGGESVDLVKQVKGNVEVVLIEGIPHTQFFTINT